MKKTKVLYFSAIGLISFLAYAGIVQATQTFDDAIAVPSLKVGSQGSGGVTFFNGTIINETTDSGGNGIPVTFGDDVRIDGTIFRGATAGPGDNYPLKLYDDVTIYGDLTVDGNSPFISGLSAGDNVAVTNNNDGTWTIAATDTDTDTDTDSNSTIFTFFIAGDLAAPFTYLDGWKPTSSMSLTPRKITVVTGPLYLQGSDAVFGFSDDGGANYDTLTLQEDTGIATLTSFSDFNSVTSIEGVDIRYLSGPGGNPPSDVNVIIEFVISE